MKQLPTTITVLITIAAFFCLALIPPGHASEKSELEGKVDAFLKVEDYERAFKLVDGFLQEHSDKPIGYNMLEKVITAGSAFLKSEDRKRAIKLVDGYIQEYPANPIGRAMMARVLAADGRTEGAFTAYYRFYKLSEAISPQLLLEIVRGGLNESDWDVRFVAVETVESLGDKGAVPALINAFNEMKRSTIGMGKQLAIMEAATALGALGDKRATPALIAALDDGDIFVRGTAITALGMLGDKSAAPYLIEALNDENDGDTRGVVKALGRLGDGRASLALYNVLKASESYDRVRAALALAKVGDGFYKEYSISALIDILNDDSNDAQALAAAALAELSDERGVSAVLDALKNNINVWLGSAAQIRLGEKGDMRAVPYLIAILNGRYSNTVRYHAAMVLGELGDKRAISALLGALSNDGGTVHVLNKLHMLTSGVAQVRAAEALAKLGDKRGIPHLMNALNDGNDNVRGHAAVALAELGDESIAPNLVEILGGDESIELKFWAAEALVKLSQ